MSDVIRDLQATHTRRSPVFVIGFPRSGTSITCRLLRRYLKVSFGTESQFIIRYLRRLSEFGDLRDDANVRRLLYEISTERFFARSRHNWGFVFDVEQAINTLTSRSYSAVLHAIFNQLADHNGMVRWGDKTPAYNYHLRELRQLFPDAQFVHVVRDGRDVALSIQKQGFGAKNACQAAGEWTRAIDSITAFSQDLSDDQYVEVRYEDLTSRPAAVVEELADFLGIDDRTGELRTYVHTHIQREITQDNSGKWHQALSAREVERFEAVAGDILAHFGYHLAYQGHARPVSALERRYWNLRGRTDRWLMRTYWADNLYKIAVKSRRLLTFPRRGRPAESLQRQHFTRPA
ncbi:MAG: sulfotransferase [Acidobacteria bacterium]|nr:sulfotransferase [Acidobacteriota bacterium]